MARLASDFVRTGLSPRVRGNLRVVLGAIQPFGSIPACAGEPPQPKH